ncbi:nitroreductase [Pelotomaculum thermopropionicum SI]|uniref:Nitroreductase n=1 Tax=Pelotomaculum thermopropionicum (strain DSM 13744 / JCM 10971 / SI) TaxID=370438 RepID=A5CZH0_PELTS|nr:nitroreductase [Pelotomaculum thermopropionicum SI]
MTNETIEVIMRRRSIRDYKPDQIEEEKLQIILEAAKFAPNAGGRQLWHFTVIQNKKVIEDMVEKMINVIKQSGNENLQKKISNPDYHTFYNAPTVIVVSGAENARLIEIDCAAATENMLIAAESMGISSCWIGSAELVLSDENVKKTLGIPAGYKPLYAVSLGYSATKDKEQPVPRKENTVNFVR